MCYRDVGEDGGSDEVALLVAGNDDVAAVQEATGSLVDSGLDEFVDLVLGLRGDDRSDIRVGQVT